MKVSWQPSSNLNKDLIDEYERGVVCEVEDVVSPSYGSTAHTTIVNECKVDCDGPPPSKKLKQSSPDDR